MLAAQLLTTLPTARYEHFSVHAAFWERQFERRLDPQSTRKILSSPITFAACVCVCLCPPWFSFSPLVHSRTFSSPSTHLSFRVRRHCGRKREGSYENDLARIHDTVPYGKAISRGKQHNTRPRIIPILVYYIVRVRACLCERAHAGALPE